MSHAGSLTPALWPTVHLDLGVGITLAGLTPAEAWALVGTLECGGVESNPECG